MTTALSSRQGILFLALAATLAAAFWVSRQDDTRATAVKRAALRLPAPSSPLTPPATLPAAHTLRLPVRALVDTPVTDIFASATARQVTPSTTEKPVAPPLPFNFIGRYVEAGVTYVFLELDSQLHTVKAGDTIDNTYRIERIDKDIHLIYLPLKERQTLPIGDMQ